MTLENIINCFIEYRSSFCSLATMNDYHTSFKIFRRYLEERFGCTCDNLDVNKLSYLDIVSYQTWLREHESHITKRKLAIRSIITYMIDCRTFCNFLYEFEYTSVNLFKHVKIIKKDEPQLIPLTVDEAALVDSVFDLKSYNGYRNYLMFHMFLDCGLRNGEVCKLKKSDIDLKSNYVLVNGKGRKQRIVPLPPFMVKHFKVYLQRFLPEDADFLFMMVDSFFPCTADSVKDVFQRVKRRTGIKRLYPHMLRHTFATSYIVHGGDIYILKELLGHYDIVVTQEYLHDAHRISLIDYPIYKIDECFYKNRRFY